MGRGVAAAAAELEENPAKLVPNPLPRRAEIRPFESWDEIEAVAEELGPLGVIPIFAAGTGLRPEEWLALSRRDVDRVGRVVTVRRTYSAGEVREHGKTSRSRRRVPLRQRVLDPSTSSHRGSTRACSSRPYAGASSSSTTSALASGSPRSARPGSSRNEGSTT